MKTVTLPSGDKVPFQDQGTWTMGERHRQQAAEIVSLRGGDLSAADPAALDGAFPRPGMRRQLELL